MKAIATKEYKSKATSGYKMILRSFLVTEPEYRQISDEPEWCSSFVQDGNVGSDYSLIDFNYEEKDIHSFQHYKDDKAIARISSVLTDEGLIALCAVAEKLYEFSSHNDMVIAQRLRAADRYSKFLHDMLRDRQFLLRMSSIVGVPLVPHPHRNVTAQMNYYSLDRNPEAKWHLDGPDYVFTMLLTDGEEFEGGELTFFRDRRENFEENCLGDDQLYKTDLNTKGDIIFARGSHLYHCVTPLSRGIRNTLSFSLYCPYLARFDSSRFWWSAPEDGVFSTLRAWLRFKYFDRRPEYYASIVESPLISWDELK